MNKFLCIHGHFYQPPRENPWLEEVELQESAYPFHDWNQRITDECYEANGISRILGENNKIVELVNNYAMMSFNFGPTLLSWMERNAPEAYELILQADVLSQKRFDGYGSAIAQCYNHMIMPLANERDKRTQILWGIADFQYRFKRDPIGMWLPETAVDEQTLLFLAEHGIEFTILAPRQAQSVQLEKGGEWQDVSGDRVDPRHPYLCSLPGGKDITLFFYDGHIAQEVAFGGVLDNGEKFANRLLQGFSEESEQPELVHIATDGESYGHHHKNGDMALAYCLHHIEKNNLAKLTNYAHFLSMFGPTRQVRIHQNSSWSCVHGVERWRADCGCNTGGNAGWNQAWRAPLRGALDWLRDNLNYIYELYSKPYFTDCWAAREAYIERILDRTAQLDNLVNGHKELSEQDEITVLLLLEMQRYAMLMYTSCGWFFDEVSGLEPTQILFYAARAMQLANTVCGISLEQTFCTLLGHVPSNIESYQTAEGVYKQLIAPAVLDMIRVGSHAAVSSLFENREQDFSIYCYKASYTHFSREHSGKNILSTGEVELVSTITRQRKNIRFAVLYFGDYNLSGGTQEANGNEDFALVQKQLLDAFQRSDIPLCIQLIEQHFSNEVFTLWYLFKDEQRKVFAEILESSTRDIENALRHIKENNFSVLDRMRATGVPIPRALARITEAIYDLDLVRVFENRQFELMQPTIAEVQRLKMTIDKVTLGFESSTILEELVDQFAQPQHPLQPLQQMQQFLRVIEPLQLDVNVWKAQNVVYELLRNEPDVVERSEQKARDHWLKTLRDVAGQLGVAVP